jgi:hypothetical protein
MKLFIMNVDMRGGYQEPQAWQTDVVDKETDKTVGWVYAERSPASRTISLFGGKYEATFSSGHSIDECIAFAKGVEAVMNHLTTIPNEVPEASEPT